VAGDFRIHKNNFVGTIPEELFDLDFLFRFDAYEMDLTGTLSTRIGRLRQLEQLRVSRNKLTGTIPEQIANLSRLRLAWLHLNQFVGSLPVQICENVGPGLLEFLQTDCLPRDDPPNECLCCSACCNRADGICLRNEGI